MLFLLSGQYETIYLLKFKKDSSYKCSMRGGGQTARGVFAGQETGGAYRFVRAV